MSPEFKPQSATQLVLRAFTLNFQMLWTFIVIGFICFLAPMILFMIGFVMVAAGGPGSAGAGSVILGLLLIIAAFVAYFIAMGYFYAATILAVWLRLTGVKARISQIMGRLRGKVAWQSVLVAFRVGLKVMLGYLLLIIPGFIWYAKYVMAVPVAVVEQAYGRDAMDRSAELSEGNRGRLVGAFIFFVVLYYTIVFGAQFGVAPTLIAMGAPEETAKLVQSLATIISSFLFPSSLIFPVLVYFDAKRSKEALELPTIGDLDSAQAAGAGV